MQAIDKHPLRHIYNGCFLLSQLPRIGKNLQYFAVSVVSLEDVWEVSGGCMSHSGHCLRV